MSNAKIAFYIEEKLRRRDTEIAQASLELANEIKELLSAFAPMAAEIQQLRQELDALKRERGVSHTPEVSAKSHTEKTSAD